MGNERLYRAASPLPHWLRVLLLFPTFISYIPQLARIIRRKDATGVSLIYVLFNLIAATEQFAFAFLFTVNRIGESSYEFVDCPLSGGDWINFSQIGLLCVISFLTFGLCIWFPSDSNAGQKVAAVAVYALFWIISVGLVLVEYLDNRSHGGSAPGRFWFGVIWNLPHQVVMLPLVVVLLIWGTIYQARAVILRPTPGALSILGLALQAPSFTILAITWVYRLAISPTISRYSYIWFMEVGFVPVDHGVMALGQIVILGLATRYYRAKPAAEDPDSIQAEPLLAVGEEASSADDDEARSEV